MIFAAVMVNFKSNRLSDRARTYGMKVCTGKSKIITDSMNYNSVNNNMNGQRSEGVTSHKYLEIVLRDENSPSILMGLEELIGSWEVLQPLESGVDWSVQLRIS